MQVNKAPTSPAASPLSPVTVATRQEETDLKARGDPIVDQLA
jgi:hypothetical protein